MSNFLTLPFRLYKSGALRYYPLRLRLAALEPRPDRYLQRRESSGRATSGPGMKLLI